MKPYLQVFTNYEDKANGLKYYYFSFLAIEHPSYWPPWNFSPKRPWGLCDSPPPIHLVSLRCHLQFSGEEKDCDFGKCLLLFQCIKWLCCEAFVNYRKAQENSPSSSHCHWWLPSILRFYAIKKIICTVMHIACFYSYKNFLLSLNLPWKQFLKTAWHWVSGRDGVCFMEFFVNCITRYVLVNHIYSHTHINVCIYIYIFL